MAKSKGLMGVLKDINHELDQRALKANTTDGSNMRTLAALAKGTMTEFLTIIEPVRRNLGQYGVGS